MNWKKIKDNFRKICLYWKLFRFTKNKINAKNLYLLIISRSFYGSRLKASVKILDLKFNWMFKPFPKQTIHLLRIFFAHNQVSIWDLRAAEARLPSSDFIFPKLSCHFYSFFSTKTLPLLFQQRILNFFDHCYQKLFF